MARLIQLLYRCTMKNKSFYDQDTIDGMYSSLNQESLPSSELSRMLWSLISKILRLYASSSRYLVIYEDCGPTREVFDSVARDISTAPGEEHEVLVQPPVQAVPDADPDQEYTSLTQTTWESTNSSNSTTCTL